MKRRGSSVPCRIRAWSRAPSISIRRSRWRRRPGCGRRAGVRALDHAVETIYSARPHPLSDAAAARGLSLLLEHLPASLSTSGAEQLEHRLQCQMGAWLSVFGMTNAGLGLSHALGHQIGPRWNVPHGVTSCITLPHAMRFMAAAAPGALRPDRRGLSASRSSRPTPEPRRSSAPTGCRVSSRSSSCRSACEMCGCRRQEIREVADLVHDILDSAHVSDRPISREQVESVLAAPTNQSEARLISPRRRTPRVTPHLTHSGDFPFTLSAN